MWKFSFDTLKLKVEKILTSGRFGFRNLARPRMRFLPAKGLDASTHFEILAIQSRPNAIFRPEAIRAVGTDWPVGTSKDDYHSSPMINWPAPLEL